MKLYKVLILSFLLCNFSIFAARWTVLIYMEPAAYEKSDALYDAAWRNINDLARASMSDDVNILVQFHAYDSFAWRYKIEKGTVRQVGVAPLTNYYDDMSQAFKWAYGTYTAENYGLIWWGRGCGILHPQWDAQNFKWEFEDDDAFNLCLSCPTKSVALHETQAIRRAILLDSESQQYLSNQDMVKLLGVVTSIIKQKLRFVGLDCCLGASIEHAYQVAPFTEYLIGCQNCELPDGFEYCGLVNRLSDPNNSTKNVVQGIVSDYSHYYEERTKQKVYTLSAVQCCQSARCVTLLKKVVLQLCNAIQQDSRLKEIIKNSIIQKCPHFCFLPMYTDLYSVVTALINDINNEPFWQKYDNKARKNLLMTLVDLKKVVKNMVVANIAGTNMPAAHGVSIYWPLSHIDSSYFTTKFAQDSEWIALLKALDCQ